MIYLFYLFASLQLVFSWRSLAGGFTYLEFFRTELAKKPAGPFPSVSVIIPCKGLDQGLEENLSAFFEQDYPDYEIVFAIEEHEDPAAEVIAGAAAKFEIGHRVVIAGKAVDSGQKVHNLLASLNAVSDRSEVLVFADSDARPSRNWLKALVSALPEGTGCASGYRWFLSERGGLASNIRSVWNASIASALGPDEKMNFSWGGSTAIRRDVFERSRMPEVWRGTLSDDFALTRAIKDGGGAVRFVPACLTAAVEDCSFREMLEFTTRQMKITRVYSPGLWALSFVGAGLWAVSLGLAVAAASRGGPHAYVAAVFLAFVFFAGTIKAALRLKAVSLALEEFRDDVRRQMIWHLTLWAVTPFVFLFNDVAALLSRRIVWRGIEYELESPERTRVIRING